MLQTFDGELQLEVAELLGIGPGLQAVQLGAHLDSGRLSLRAAKARLALSGNVSARLDLDTQAATSNWALWPTMTRVPAALLLGSSDRSLVDAPADLSLNLKTRGDSPAHMADHLVGEARLIVDKGQARLKTLDTFVGGLSALTRQLQDGDSDQTRLNCAIADLAIDRGVGRTKVLLIDSTATTVRGEGTIDLGSEQIDLTFTPRPKTATLNVAVPVHVRGTLSNPDVQADSVASLTKLAGVVGLIVYPPAALIAFADLGDNDNACIEMLRRDTRQAEDDSSLNRLKRSADDVASRIRRGLRRVFGN